MAPLFLRSLEYSLYLLSLIQFETICIPFHLMIVSLLFVLSQNYFGFLELNCFVSAGPVLVDVSHLESLISTSVYHLRDLQHYLGAFQLMLYVVDLYQLYIISSCSLVLLLELLHLLQRHLCDQVCKLLQCNFYSTLCDCPEGQSIQLFLLIRIYYHTKRQNKVEAILLPINHARKTKALKLCNCSEYQKLICSLQQGYFIELYF